MKRFLGLFVSLMLVAPAFALPALTFSNNGLVPGDVHVTRSVDYVEPGAGGSGVVWDFSSINVVGAPYSETISVGSDRNVEVNNQGSAVFNFDVTSYGNEYYGYSTSAGKRVYEQPVLKIKYPFEYMDKHDGEYYGYLEQGSVKYAIDGNYSSEADAYGTLILPNNVVLKNVLRVRTVEAYKEYYCSTAEIEEEKYLWYAEGFRYPVFVCIHTTTKYNNKENVRKVSHANVAALEYVEPKVEEPIKDAVKVAEAFTYQIFPNPVVDMASINYKLLGDSKVKVEVFDISGVCVAKLVNGEKQSSGYYQHTFAPNVSGTYVVRFTVGKKVYTEQIVKR
jgi:hypothetical protein